MAGTQRTVKSYNKAVNKALTALQKNTTVGRFYELPSLDGEEPVQVPSATHVLSCIAKPALIPWAAKVEREMVIDVAEKFYQDSADTPTLSTTAYKMSLKNRLTKERAHKKVSAKALEIGSQIHEVIEWNNHKRMGHIVGPQTELSPEAAAGFAAYQTWADSVNLEPVLVEATVFSRTHQYAGTMDLLAKMDWEGERVLALVDFKSSSAIFSEAYLQLAAYAEALKEMGHGDPEVCLILRLPKKVGDDGFEVGVCPSPRQPLLETFLATRSLWEWFHAQERAYSEKRKAQRAAEKAKRAS
jgi:hypothetical protein